MISLYTETLEEYIRNGGNLFPDKFAFIPNFVFDDINFNAYDLFINRYKLREIGAETEQLFEEYLSIRLDKVVIEYAQKIKLYIDNFSKTLDRFATLTRNTEANKIIEGTINKGGSVSSNESNTKTGTLDTDTTLGKTGTIGNVTKKTSNQDDKTFANPLTVNNPALQDYEKIDTISNEDKTDTYNLEETEDKTDTYNIKDTGDKTDTYNLLDKENKKDTENKQETYQELYKIFRSNSQLLQEAMNIKSIYYEMIESFDTLFIGVY